MIPISPTITALAISLAVNAGLVAALMSAKTDIGEARAERDNAQVAASICSDATEALREHADKLAQEARAARADAAKASRAHQSKAQGILSAPPSVPGDDCRSAKDRAERWLKGRTQ